MALHEVMLGWRLGLGTTARLWVDVALIVIAGLVAIHIAKWRAEANVATRWKTDRTMRQFLLRTIGGGGWLAILFLVLWRAGVNVSALLGGVAVGGFIIGFALKDTLGNLASGLLLLVYRPMNIGETVRLGDHEGEVLAVGMALTVLQTPDGNTVSVPNSAVLGSAIVNRTRSPYRRVDVDCGLHNADDIGRAIEAVVTRASADPRIIADRKHLAAVTALTSDGPTLRFGFWVRNADFAAARSDMHGIVKRALDDGGFATQTSTLEIAKVAAHA